MNIEDNSSYRDHVVKDSGATSPHLEEQSTEKSVAGLRALQVLAW